jgi:hypothetical protein
MNIHPQRYHAIIHFMGLKSRLTQLIIDLTHIAMRDHMNNIRIGFMPPPNIVRAKSIISQL